MCGLSTTCVKLHLHISEEAMPIFASGAAKVAAPPPIAMQPCASPQSALSMSQQACGSWHSISDIETGADACATVAGCIGANSSATAINICERNLLNVKRAKAMIEAI
jgi:hypothetical protein